MRTYGVYQENENERVDIAVWYPAVSRGKSRELEGWQVLVAGTTRPHAGLFPITLISHDTASSRFANNDVATAIATHGNIVISVTHNQDNVYSSEALYTAKLLTKRPRQLLIALETVLNSTELGPHADESRIGLLGVGFGAITAMQVAGLAPKMEIVENFCRRTSSSDIFCDSWSGRRLRNMVNEIPHLRTLYGENVLTPPLTLFAQKFRREATRPKTKEQISSKKALTVNATSTPKIGIFRAMRQWLKKGKEKTLVDNTPPNEIINLPKKSGTEETPASLHFQEGSLLARSRKGIKFADISLDGLTLFWVDNSEQEPSPASTENPLEEQDIRQAREPFKSVRKVRSIAFLAPAGGMLFEGYNPLPIPAAIIGAGSDLLYPYPLHGAPYEQLFSVPPQRKIIPELDHFSLFAPCSEELAATLEEVCGRVKGDARLDLSNANADFLATFFSSTLGGPTMQPEDAEAIAKPQAKESKKIPLGKRSKAHTASKNKAQ